MATFIEQIKLPTRPSKMMDEGGPKIVTSALPCRYFRGLVSSFNDKSKEQEFSVELLVPKTDTAMVDNILSGIELTVDFQLKNKKAKDVKQKKSLATIRKNFESAKEKFFSGDSNVDEYEVDGEDVEKPNGLFSIANAKGLLFHWPIRDGDLIRKDIVNEDTGEINSELECHQPIGRGGELKGCYLIRIKLKENGKGKDGKAYTQKPTIVDSKKVSLTEEDADKFASLDVGRFIFKLYCYLDLDDATSGVTAFWKSAQHLYDTEYRVTSGGSTNDGVDEFEDEDFEEVEDNWED